MSGSQHLLLGAIPQVVDQYFENTTLLLPGNGTNGAQNNTFLDGSTNNFTITRNGNTTQGTFSPYGDNWSNYFDGSGDYLQPAANSAFAFGTGNFTVECWIYATDANDDGIYEGRSDGVTADGFTITAFSSSVIRMYTSSALITASGLNYLNQWTHVALVCNAGTTTLYINGVSVGSTTTVTNCTNTNPVIGIGRYSASTTPTAASSFNGYISNFRVVKGTAVYTAAFTPPAAPLTAITNTSLLTCQSNRFIDNSSNAFAITRNGDVSVQRFSPFNPTAAYSASTIGGSGYFDGSGDYLTVTNDTAINPGTGDFTLECWVYATGAVTNDSVFEGSQSGLVLAFDASSQLAVAQSNVAYIINDTVAFPLNQWVHIAVARSGTTLSLFKNGSRVATATNSTNFVTSTENRIGRSAGTDYFTGYISNLRFVKGTAVYSPSSTTLTVPTSPVTAISGTGLLANFTNAAILDNAMMNDLETVGNAQISTTQSKFGGSSMYFDGTGDYLVSNAATTDLYAFGTGDFTIELWVYLNTTSGTPIIYDSRPASTNGAQPTLYMNGAVITYFTNNGNRITGSSLSTSTWYHIALTRSGTSTKLFVDGTQVGSTYTDSTNYSNSANRPLIGVDSASGNTNYFNGYINDLRVTKGIARYTANFTAPTAAFPLL